MDTTLKRRGQAAGWNERARAGLEEPPNALFGPDVPYVVKSPWLFCVIDEVLRKARSRIDGLIVPIRALEDVARSRTTIERTAMSQTQGAWLNQLESPWDVWAAIPGGIMYSLNEVDQARVLAVGFHHLIERCVAADVPIAFIHFPRMVMDADYLFAKLGQFLPAAITAEQSRNAIARVADLSKIRQWGQPR